MNARPSSLILLLCLILTGSASLLGPNLAMAAESKSDDSALEAARVRFKEGVRHFDAKKYGKARAAFLQAYALKKHPTVLLNLAHSELRSGYEADAATHYTQLLRESHDEITSAERKRATAGLAKARAQVGELTLSIDVIDAEVLLNGELVGQSPLPDPLFMPPGSHVIEVRKEGDSVTRNVTAMAGVSGTEKVSLLGDIEAGAGGAGSGEQDVEADAGYGGPGREPFFSWLSHSPGALIGAGVFLVGGATATAFAISSATNYSSAEDTKSSIMRYAESQGHEAPCQPRSTGYLDDRYVLICQDYVDYRDTADNHKNIAVVSGVISGLALTATIVAYFIDAEVTPASASTPNRGRLALVPVATREQRSLHLVGRF
jgi:hypothetical protein